VSTAEIKSGVWGKPLPRGTELPIGIVNAIYKIRYLPDTDWIIQSDGDDMWIIYKTWGSSRDVPVFELGAAKIEYLSSNEYRENGELYEA
jgi:hypothetical protein